MKQYLTLLLLAMTTNSIMAQTSTSKNYYIDGTMSIGRGKKIFADSSAWLHIGKDTTSKGVIMPNVMLDSIKTKKRGLFVYSLEDSVLYHFDSNKRVRYMTYKDTTFIKQLITQNSNGGGSNKITNGGDSFGANISIGTNDAYDVKIHTNGIERVSVSDEVVLNTPLKIVDNNTTHSIYNETVGNSKPMKFDNPGASGGWSGGFSFNAGASGSGLNQIMYMHRNGAIAIGTAGEGDMQARNRASLTIKADNANAYANNYGGDVLMLSPQNFADYNKSNGKIFNGILIGSDASSEDMSGQTSVGIGYQWDPLTSGWASSMIFSTTDDGNNWNEVMRVAGRNNSVGIGTTSPTAKLHVATDTGGIKVDHAGSGSGHFYSIIRGGSAYHPVSNFDIGLSNYGTRFESHSVDFFTYNSTTTNRESTLYLSGGQPPAGRVDFVSNLNGAYAIDLKGGVLGTGWKLYAPEGIWSYKHTSFPYQAIDFQQGSSTCPDMQFNSKNVSNILKLWGQTGNVAIGSITTDNGYKLDVNGTSRFAADVMIEGGLVFNQGNKTISITEGNTVYQPVSVNIGRSNVLNTNDNGRHITIGNNNTGNTSKIWQYMIGQGNNLSTANLGCYSIGDYNTITSGDTYQYIYGSSNTINYPSTTTSRGQFVIGNSNSILHKYSSIMGNNQSTTADNQLIFAGGNANTNAGGYRDIYFGSGPKSSLSTGVGAPVTINSSGGNGTDKSGGLLRLAAGKSTGSAIAPDLIFTTATSSTSGTTLQTLTDRWYVKGETGQLSNVSTPNASAIVDIQSTTQGVLLSRMTTTQRDALTAVEGLEIYNVTTHKKQVYDGTTWQDCW